MVYLLTEEAVVQKRCDRNRKRSKRRAIYCPEHGCFIDSVSQKYPLYTEDPEHLQQRGYSRRVSLLLVATKNVVPLNGEWLEAFWCNQCQETRWYYVKKVSDREYLLDLAPRELWERVSGVISPSGNPSVSDFTRRQSRMLGAGRVRDFTFVK
jgi:hypothetical protein